MELLSRFNVTIFRAWLEHCEFEISKEVVTYYPPYPVMPHDKRPWEDDSFHMCVDITPYAQLSPMPTFMNYVTLVPRILRKYHDSHIPHHQACDNVYRQFSYFSLFYKKLVKNVFWWFGAAYVHLTSPKLCLEQPLSVWVILSLSNRTALFLLLFRHSVSSATAQEERLATSP